MWQKPPQLSRAAMAQRGAPEVEDRDRCGSALVVLELPIRQIVSSLAPRIPARNYRRYPGRLDGRRPVAHGVHPLVEPVQPTTAHAP